MSEFQLRKHATFGPTSCVFCGDPEGPFIDTHTELVGYGHLWVCSANERRPGCVRQMARLDGMLDPDERRLMVNELIELESQVFRLKEALREKQVPVGELLDVLKA